MRRTLLALATAALLLTAFSGSAAAADPVVIGTRIEGAERLTVGDRFRIVITLEADAGTTVSLAPGALPPELSLVETPEVTTRPRANGRVEMTISVLVAPFFVGEYQLPPLTLRYRDAAGAVGELRTQGVTVSVRSVLPSSGQITPRDLKPQAEIGTPPAPPYLLIALGVLALALLLVLGVLYWRLTRPAPVYVEPTPEFVPVGPEDRARLALDNAAATFAAERDYVALYATLAGTVRGYLTDRFGFTAYALTTRELEDRMRRLGIDRWQVRLVTGLLQQCDAVVFAEYRPASSRTDADITAAYEIVEMSRPPERERQVEVVEVALP